MMRWDKATRLDVKKILLIACMSILLSSFSPVADVHGQTKKIDVNDFFMKLKKQNTSLFGKGFSSSLESTLIKAQLKNIPSDMIEFEKKPRLVLKFASGKKPLLVLENVSPFYANYFLPYEEIIQKSGLFLGVDDFNSYQSFIKEYQIQKLLKVAGGYSATIRQHDGLDGDYATFFFDENLKIKRADFFESNTVSASLKFFFDEKTLPKRLVLEISKDNDKVDHFIINFKNYTFL